MKLVTALTSALVLSVVACSSDATSFNPGSGDDDAGGATGDASIGESDSAPPRDDGGPSADASPPVDGGSDGGSSDGGDAGGGCGALAFCDGFEAYTGPVGAKLGPWTASMGGTGTTMTVDTTKSFRGTKSLHIAVPAGPAAHATLNRKAAGGLVTGNNLFGRAMVFYSNTGGNGLPIGVHSWLFNSDGTSAAAGGAVHMNMGGGGAKMQLNYHAPAPKPEESVQGGTMTAGAWHCVQWQYDGSGTPVKDAAKVWVDGALAVDVAKAKGWDLATPWSSMDFGFTHYQTLANSVDVYLDEFAVDGAMVACP